MTDPSSAPVPSRRRRRRAAPGGLEHVPGSGRRVRRTWRFSVGDVLGRTITTWFANILPFGALTLVVFSPYIALTYYSNVVAPETLEDPSYAMLDLVVLQVLSYIATASLIFGVFQQLRGRKPSLGDSVSVGLRRVPPVLGVALLVGLCLIGVVLPWAVFGAFGGEAGMAAAMVGMLVSVAIVATGLFVAVPAAVVERPGVFGALARSWQLTKGCRIQIFVIYLALVLLNIVGGAMVGGVGALLVGADAIWIPVLVVTLLAVSLQAVASTVVYHDLKIAVEGTSTEELASIFN